jgi:hypothetical protein
MHPNAVYLNKHNENRQTLQAKFRFGTAQIGSDTRPRVPTAGRFVKQHIPKMG